MLDLKNTLVCAPQTYYFFIKTIFIIGILLVTNTCAAIKPLEGGPKDTASPKLIRTYPEQESTNNFQLNKEKPVIQLIFDKEIEIQDIYNKLIVTPKLARREEGFSYICKVNKNTLVLSLEVSLEKDTTYTFNFKDAIRDTHEGTPAENPSLTFSTGPQIDTMFITGQVRLLMTDQPTKGLVALYKFTEIENTHILNGMPDYFTESKEDGTFRLEHIKKGIYRLCAGQSKKNKLILDPSQEPYGFIEAPLELNQPIENIPLYIVQANINDLKVQGSKPHGQYFEINFSKPIKAYSLTLKHIPKRLQSAAILYSHLIEGNSTLRVYNTLGLLEDDLLEANLEALDEMDNTIQQAIKLQFKDRQIAKEPFQYTMQPLPGSKINPHFLQVEVKCSKPIKNIQASNIFLLTGQKEKWPISLEEITIHPDRNAITIRKNLNLLPMGLQGGTSTNQDKDQVIILQIEKGAFVSVEKELNEAGTYQYLLKNSQECGSIQGKVITKAPGFIIQLLDKDYQVIDEIRNQRYYTFKEVLPGNYWVRVLVTPTKEGKWRFGNIHKWISPDPVIFYPHELAIVAKWELEDIDLVF